VRRNPRTARQRADAECVKGWPGSNAPKRVKGARAHSSGTDCSAVPIAVQVMQIAGDDRTQDSASYQPINVLLQDLTPSSRLRRL
jgi:hypothetical protein